MDRIFYAWTAVFIFRFWCLWINETKKQDLDIILSKLVASNITSKKEDKKKKNTQSKRQYFITYQSHFSIEINAHTLVYLATLVCEGQVSSEALAIWLLNSQSCEDTFRSARSISSLSSAGVNFTVSQFLNRINKLAVLQSIKSNVKDNKLHFPQHHKLSTTLQNSSNSLNMNNLSKTSIENSVLRAYRYVIDLFAPLKIKQFSNNGRPIAIQKLSDAILRRFQALWATTITRSDITSQDTDELDDEIDDDDDTDDSDVDIDNNTINNLDDYDSNDELELENNKDAIVNVNISTNHGVRLFDSVKQELADSYFQVTINNKTKYLHKQSACWLLQKEKPSLSADRLSRVQGK